MKATRRIRAALAWLALAACAMAFAPGALAEALSIPVKINGAACTVNVVDVTTDAVVASRDFARDELADLKFAASADASYRISLNGGESADVDYDSAAYIVTNPGTWVMYVEGKSANDKKATAVFTNTEKTKTSKPFIDPPVTKRVEGDGAPKETFTFTIEAVRNDAGYSLANMPMPNGKPGPIATAQVEGQGSTEFGRIDFDRAGTYVYRVTEVVNSTPGYTYDRAVYTVIAEVTEADGALVATRSITKDGEAADDIVFTNRYSATAATTAAAGPAVTDTASPAVTDTASPAVTDTASPAVTDTASPAVADTASPAVADTASPAVTDTASPAVADTASPAVTDTASPAVTDTASPTPTTTASPTPTTTASPTPTVAVTAASGSDGSSGGSNDGTSPRTGDDRHLELWLGASAALLCAIVALAIYYLRSRRRDKHAK